MALEFMNGRKSKDIKVDGAMDSNTDKGISLLTMEAIIKAVSY